MNVALVTVGDELLAGDTVNTNAAWLGRRLAERGVTVERVTTVPDRTDDIAEVVTEYRERYDAVLVTGGLGPTHDDVTMAAVARAFGVDLIESESVLEWLAENGGYSRQDLTEGTSHVPEGARPLHNDVGVAPGCVIGTVYVLPGVPSEMEAMFERVAGEFDGEVSHVEFVDADEPESGLLDRFEALRERFEVKVGSYPGEHVRVKLEGEREEVERAAAWLRANVTAPGEE
ncbi:competence/damage-inducible protein A [Salinirubellus sp. GCM10025818]|uniref:competence/damage-inducible protein A n=1 Tax=Salinirubellus TaxID=2162630 RepID=UPI0030D0D166